MTPGSTAPKEGGLKMTMVRGVGEAARADGTAAANAKRQIEARTQYRNDTAFIERSFPVPGANFYLVFSAPAMRSLKSEGVIGTSATASPSGTSASLTAQDIAAGAPRYPPSPDPFCPKAVSGESVQ